MIEAVGGRTLGGDGDGGRWLWSPVVRTRGVIGRVKVRRGRGERKGRQVGQFEGFLFSAKGSVYGMRGGLFTVISILRGVCYGRIVSSGRGRVAHLRVTDDKAAPPNQFSLLFFPAPTLCLALVCLDNPPFVSKSPTLILSRSLARQKCHSPSSHPLSFLAPESVNITHILLCPATASLPRNPRGIHSGKLLAFRTHLCCRTRHSSGS